jgi:hypothetical protein
MFYRHSFVLLFCTCMTFAAGCGGSEDTVVNALPASGPVDADAERAKEAMAGGNEAAENIDYTKSN